MLTLRGLRAPYRKCPSWDWKSERRARVARMDAILLHNRALELEDISRKERRTLHSPNPLHPHLHTPPTAI